MCSLAIINHAAHSIVSLSLSLQIEFLKMTVIHRNFVWDLALVKIYANCLMSSLNARSGLADTVASYGNSAPKYVSSSDNHRVPVPLSLVCTAI